MIGNTDMATKSGVESATGGSDAEADEKKATSRLPPENETENGIFFVKWAVYKQKPVCM